MMQMCQNGTLTMNIAAFKTLLLHTDFEAYEDHSALVHIAKAKNEPKTLRIHGTISSGGASHVASSVDEAHGFDQPPKEDKTSAFTKRQRFRV